MTRLPHGRAACCTTPPPLLPRFSQFPRDLAERSFSTRFGDIPALLAHPDWRDNRATVGARSVPTILWLHGRTANKELDPGRYLRWIRAGFAACAIDLPGHGERAIEGYDLPARTLDVLEQALAEVDAVVEHLADPTFHNAFDLNRLAIGGMSLGGMVALRRLCTPHPFKCAAVEATTGWLTGLYAPDTPHESTHVPRVAHPPERIKQLDPLRHLVGKAGSWKPIPLLALHSETDQLIPFAVQQHFIQRLREFYQQRGVGPSIIEFVSWPETGAPLEHIGFGRMSNDAKNLQVDFFQKRLA